MGTILFVLFQAALVNNFVLSKFLGLCPFVGVSSKKEASMGMGIAVTFVMVVASVITWLLQYWVLVPLQAEYLQTIFFILVIAAVVQFIEMFINKTSPVLKKSLGIYLPLITTNCAVLGVTVLNVMNDLSFFISVLYAFGAGLGFMLALIIMAGIRERLDEAQVPKSFKGVPIAFLVGGILSLAFMAFAAF